MKAYYVEGYGQVTESFYFGSYGTGESGPGSGPVNMTVAGPVAPKLQGTSWSDAGT